MNKKTLTYFVSTFISYNMKAYNNQSLDHKHDVAQNQFLSEVTAGLISVFSFT